MTTDDSTDVKNDSSPVSAVKRTSGNNSNTAPTGKERRADLTVEEEDDSRKPPKKKKSLSIKKTADAPVVSPRASGSQKKPGTPTAATKEGGIDTHPYPRGSVIEVLYTAKHTSARSDDDDDASEEEKESGVVRLCDVIDRAPHGGAAGSKWKYYVHYRDFNRRMDEWITDTTRIVSPPSVGNAKVRALKKIKDEQEKKLKDMETNQARDRADGPKDEQEQDDDEEEMEDDMEDEKKKKKRRGEISGTDSYLERPRMARSSSRRSVLGGDDEGEDAEGAQHRLTRRQRRKSRVVPDDGGPTMGTTGTTTEDVEGGVSSTSIGVVATLLSNDKDGIKDKVVTVAAQELDEHEGLDEASLREHEEVTKVKNVSQVQLGPYRMDTWYFSPIPKEMLKDGNGMIDVLYVCEFTLNFFARKVELLRFQAKELRKNRRYPPGNEIYRNGNLSMFEVDGFEERLYCQNLCYIAKLFLDHKTLYFDVDPFLFYVLCEVDGRGFHPVGYFSKEKYSDVGYNLACILTFPCHQRKGYGRFLIAFSYELSKKEEKVGSPEKPMSDLGQQAYKPYWTSTIVDFLLSNEANSMSIMEISKLTSIMAEDIIFTLNQLGILKYINGIYFITAERRSLEELAKKHPVKEPRVDPSKLHWTPFVTDVRRDKFSIHSKKPSVEEENIRGIGGF